VANNCVESSDEINPLVNQELAELQETRSALGAVIGTQRVNERIGLIEEKVGDLIEPTELVE